MTSPESSPTLHGGPHAKLRAHLGSLQGSFRRIAQWLMDQEAEDLEPAEFTSGEIGRQVGTSRATVVRFCQHLGYKGFPDFKAAWMQEMMQQASARPQQRALPDVAYQVAEMTIASMDESLALLDTTAFARAVDVLCSARTVLLYGLIDSFFVAQSIEHKLTRAAKRAKAVSQPEEMLAQGRMMAVGDVVVVISQSGAIKEVVPSVRELRSRGCIIITVTSQVHSVLAQCADILLVTAARDVTVAGQPITLRAPQTMLLDMLVLEMVARRRHPPMQLAAR